MPSHKPKNVVRIINSVAPIRICDNGGWTDTWFAEHGKIFNIGVYPYAEVQIEVYHRLEQENRIIIQAENYGDRYVLTSQKQQWNKHPLLEAAIKQMNIPDDIAFQVTIYSEAPAGASTGTSAAVTVALIGALNRLTPGHMTPHQVAYSAHAVETEMLHQQCGIQDQLCSAYGGINYIEMFKYPHAAVSQIQIPNATWWELERRLVLIYLGQSHKSTAIHERIIKVLKYKGPDCKQLNDLRTTAEASCNALYNADFKAFGQAMTNNTQAQAHLHPDLISPAAHKIIEIARKYGAIGWKINGAGADGGSITLLCNSMSYTKRAMIREIEASNNLFKNIPIYLSRHGLRIWEQNVVDSAPVGCK